MLVYFVVLMHSIMYEKVSVNSLNIDLMMRDFKVYRFETMDMIVTEISLVCTAAPLLHLYNWTC